MNKTEIRILYRHRFIGDWIQPSTWIVWESIDLLLKTLKRHPFEIIIIYE